MKNRRFDVIFSKFDPHSNKNLMCAEWKNLKANHMLMMIIDNFKGLKEFFNDQSYEEDPKSSLNLKYASASQIRCHQNHWTSNFDFNFEFIQ